MVVCRTALTDLADSVASHHGTSVALNTSSVSRITDHVVTDFDIAGHQRISRANASVKHLVARYYRPTGEDVLQSRHDKAAKVELVVGDDQSRQGSNRPRLKGYV